MPNMFALVNIILSMIGLVLIIVLEITGGAYSCFTAKRKTAA
jgi:hypothetical protein